MKKINYMILACSLLLCSGCNFNLNQDDCEFSSEIIQTTGIKLYQNRSVGDTITYSYELVPSSAIDDLEITMSWRDPTFIEPIGSYFDYSISHVNKSFTITKKLDFDHQAVVTIYSNLFDNVQAYVSVDLKQKSLDSLGTSGIRNVYHDISEFDYRLFDLIGRYLQYSQCYTIALNSSEKADIIDDFISDKSLVGFSSGSLATFDLHDDGFFGGIFVYQSLSDNNLDFSNAVDLYYEGILDSQFGTMDFANSCWHLDENNHAIGSYNISDFADYLMADLVAEGVPTSNDPDISAWYSGFTSFVSNNPNGYTHLKFAGLSCAYVIKYKDSSNVLHNFETINETLNMIVSIPNSYFTISNINAQSNFILY